MIFYIASPTYQQIISRTIQESGEIVVGNECREDFYLHKYIKENISSLNGIDILIIDISRVQDGEEEIIQALEMLRMMYYDMRIIILAATRYEGDDLLMKCFQMSVYDIINTDDFLQIKEELLHSIVSGKQYKDALRFKDSKPLEKVVIKQEIKQTVYKVMIALAGSESRIGVTHNSIVLANYLRKRGYMVALSEMNTSGAFEKIRESFEESMFDSAYFNLAGVDYYPNVTENALGSILGKSYNFVLVDFGDFTSCDRVTFNKSDVRIIFAGAKPWEVENVNRIFAVSSEETLKGYHFYFNFVMENSRQDIKDGMDKLESVHFLNYNEDPFNAADFADANIILETYMPIKIGEKKKKSLFKKKI